ncbi:FIG00481961: hypothetical protein [hydrothermal vent metagenome]|uniref:Cytoplasmic protein n=1 Tax=hydrothermal vent metagenome TaxID=652676 RepID=A0A3B0SGS2_9ZZZZ
MTDILMPKATAVWLIDNTSLTFGQIAAFCGLHPLEIKGIADGDVAQGVRGLDPISGGQLTRDEIAKAEGDSDFRMQAVIPKHVDKMVQKRRGPRYTPVSRRQNRPDSIAWMVRNHPEVSDAQISKLIGTTKPTITSVRERSHWNASQIKPVDPVSVGLCTQIDLDAVVQKAAAKKRKMDEKAGILPDEAESDTLAPADGAAVETIEEAPQKEVSAESVFGSFSNMADKDGGEEE